MPTDPAPVTTTAATFGRRFLVVALVVPLALTAVALTVQLLALPAVPDPVAIHWGAGGEPDGFGPPWTVPLLTGVLGVGLPLLLGLPVLAGLRTGRVGAAYRLLGAMSLALVVLLDVLSTWTLLMQVGLDDAEGAPAVWLPLAVAYLLAVLAGVLGWRALPAVAAAAPPVASAVPLRLEPGQRVVWVRTATMGRAGLPIAVALALLPAAAIWAWATATILVASVITAVAILVLVAAAATTAFVVRVDQGGLTVRSTIGVPCFRVPAADIATVGVADVSPMADFGGWGVRGTRRRRGIVLRGGPALAVTCVDGRQLVVTVDDAETAAALLAAVAGPRAEPQ